MNLRCPACGELNELVADAACQRCSCDLSMLSSVVRSAAGHLQASAAELRQREWEAALWHAEQSWGLFHTPRAARFACLAAAALGDSARVWHWLPHARQTEQP